MNAARIALLLFGLSLSLTVSSCSFFSSSEPAAPAVGTQEYDPYSNSWKTSNRVVVPPTSQPNTALVEKAEQQKADNSVLKKVKKPFSWLPFVD